MTDLVQFWACVYTRMTRAGFTLAIRGRLLVSTIFLRLNVVNTLHSSRRNENPKVIRPKFSCKVNFGSVAVGTRGRMDNLDLLLQLSLVPIRDEGGTTAIKK